VFVFPWYCLGSTQMLLVFMSIFVNMGIWLAFLYVEIRELIHLNHGLEVY